MDTGGRTARRVKGAHAVIRRRHLFGKRVALALGCNQVEQDRFLQGLCRLQKRLHLFDVVPVHRAKIGKAQGVKQI